MGLVVRLRLTHHDKQTNSASLVRTSLGEAGLSRHRPLAQPGAICHGLADDDAPLVGAEQFRRYAEGLMSLFSAMEVEIDYAIEQGEHVAARWTVRATTEGGRPVTFQGICWFTIRNQKFVEGWNQFDFGKMMRQLHPG